MLIPYHMEGRASRKRALALQIEIGMSAGKSRVTEEEVTFSFERREKGI